MALNKYSFLKKTHIYLSHFCKKSIFKPHSETLLNTVFLSAKKAFFENNKDIYRKDL